MDLSFSPDVDAWVCYLILVVISIVVAVQQVGRRLEGVEGIWRIRETWFLLAAYVVVPLVLFWFLDRTSVVLDTSLVAAILVALGYERIMTGTGGVVSAPSTVMGMWAPFLSFANQIAARVRQSLALNAGREADALVARMTRRSSLYKALEELAIRRSDNAAALKADLKKVDDQADTLGPTGVIERKTRRLYAEIIVVSGYRQLLRQAKIMPVGGFLRVWAVGWIRPTVLAAVIGIPLVAIIRPWSWSDTEIVDGYYLWRLSKANSSAQDQNRAENRLIGAMREDAARRASIVHSLMALLRDPGLSTPRAGQVLQTILASRKFSNGSDVANLGCQLALSLRTANVDIRARVQQALLYLDKVAVAPPAGAGLSGEEETGLKTWTPIDKDSTTDVERFVDLWTKRFGADPRCAGAA